MFCSKCGNQVEDSMKFCNKCGSSLGNIKPTNEPNEQDVIEQEVPIKKIEKNQSFKSSPNIKQYVESKVKETTDFNSIEELLNTKKHFRFALICIVIGLIPAISILSDPTSLGIGGGVFVALLMAVVMGGVTAYIPAWFVGGIIKFKLRKKTYEFIENVDLENLSKFMEHNMKQIADVFDNFECKDENTISFEYNQRVKITTKFDKKDQRHFFYMFATKLGVTGVATLSGNGLNYTRTNAGFKEYNALYKSAPIVNAVIQNYIENTITKNN